ncbi:L,D-transpeptidase [Spongisporangium articulatum]|uniref:L,D-transpeptidase n=1 Tax=Spongisporangium articulatum TaxID=3362603 RepID=A0ABW8AJA3_9ACTN
MLFRRSVTLGLLLCLAGCGAVAPESAREPGAPSQNLRAALAEGPLTISASSEGDCRYASGADQVVVVRASGTHATVTACTRTDGGYVASLGPWSGRVGAHGVAAAGQKREGDLRTPTGTFPLRSGFGTAPDPGVRIGWFRVGRRDVWVDDPASRLYNSHRRAPARGRWDSAEKLHVRAYRFAQVIGYNEAAVPGRGSAIFLHVDTGRATAGCVSLPKAALVRLLRWEQPGAVIRIS